MLFAILLFCLGEEQDERKEAVKMSRYVCGTSKMITARFNNLMGANVKSPNELLQRVHYIYVQVV